MSDALEQALHRLRSEREARAARATPAFSATFDALRAWQAERMAALHRPIAARYNGDALCHFLTSRFYLEADWSELTAKPRQIAQRTGRIINDDRALIVSVKLQTSADVLDARMTDALLADSRAKPRNEAKADAISPHAYVRAFQNVGEAAARRQQIAWISELVDLLGGYADNRAAYWAFKLARHPAAALGMKRTYGLLAEGFAAMRSSRDLEAATHEALALQHRVLDRLLTDA